MSRVFLRHEGPPGAMAMSVVDFIGDSHLARARRSLALMDTVVHNRAIGGSTVLELRTQLNDPRPCRCGAVVMSIGTNDAAPWRGVRVDTFARALASTFDVLEPVGIFYLSPPGVVEFRLAANTPWSNAAIDDYRSAALDVCQDRNVPVIRADRVLEPFGAKAFSNDGVHLSGIGYRALLPIVSAAVTAS